MYIIVMKKVNINIVIENYDFLLYIEIIIMLYFLFISTINI